MNEALHSITTGHEATTKTPVRQQTIDLNFDTLLSPATSIDEAGEYAHIEGIMRSVFGDLTKNPEREKKYKDFIRAAFNLDKLWRIAGLQNPEHRFRAFILIYAQQRLFDDIVDGDTPAKVAPAARVSYAEGKIANLESGNLNEGDMIEAFAIKIMSDIEVLNPNYVEKAKERLVLIMQSIAFDGKRILEREQTGELQFLPEAELEEHFYNLDIEGTIGLSLFLFGLEDSEKNMELLKPLGEAVRVSYNIGDLFKDLRDGLCNISQEDAARLGITEEHLRMVIESGDDVSKFPENIKSWLGEQLARGKALMEKHHDQPLSQLEILVTPENILQKIKSRVYKEFVKRKVFDVAYIQGAEAVFRETERSLR